MEYTATKEQTMNAKTTAELDAELHEELTYGRAAAKPRTLDISGNCQLSVNVLSAHPLDPEDQLMALAVIVEGTGGDGEFYKNYVRVSVPCVGAGMFCEYEIVRDASTHTPATETGLELLQAALAEALVIMQVADAKLDWKHDALAGRVA